ncbi:MAG: DUF6428 family protein [Pseudomonadota bacterium]
MTDTLNALVQRLAEAPEGAEVVFHDGAREVGRGYHITELKLAQIESIDCGGVRNSWTETQLQLMEGAADSAMQAGKMAAILSRSAESVKGLGEAPLSIEYGPLGGGLSRHGVSVSAEDGAIRIDLTQENAVCKVMVRAGADAESCCAPKPAATQCCGPTPAVQGCC